MPTKVSLIDRFLDKIELKLSGNITDCWIWLGSKVGKSGYGKIWNEGTVHPSHRISYELFIGSIPKGLQLDHLCRNRICVNPYHLEPVTQRENLLRGNTIASKESQLTHCPKGHPYEGENLVYDDGSRRCRTCRNEQHRLQSKRYYQKTKQRESVSCQ